MSRRRKSQSSRGTPLFDFNGEMLLDMSLPDDKPKDHRARWAVKDRLLAAQFGITLEELLK